MNCSLKLDRRGANVEDTQPLPTNLYNFNTIAVIYDHRLRRAGLFPMSRRTLLLDRCYFNSWNQNWNSRNENAISKILLTILRLLWTAPNGESKKQNRNMNSEEVRSTVVRTLMVLCIGPTFRRTSPIIASLCSPLWEIAGESRLPPKDLETSIDITAAIGVIMSREIGKPNFQSVRDCNM
jgi:hypothetical protein